MAAASKRTPALGDTVIVPIEALTPVSNNGAQEAPAVITRVWSDDMINVRVLLDATERVIAKTSIKLHPSRDEWAAARDDGAAYGCYWPADDSPSSGRKTRGGAQ